MNIKLKNQNNSNVLNYFDIENPSRTIILSSDVNESSVGEIIQNIYYINDYDDDIESNLVDYIRRPIKLIINSFGGSIYDGFALIGVIENSKTPIHTYCYGSAMSMALLIMVSGHVRYGHRLSTFMYHECLDELAYDKLSNIDENINETKRIMLLYDEYLLFKTKLKKKQLDRIKKLKTDWYFGSNEALKYGIIDLII
jgi:ATP-dependent Clp protease protease subunit